MADIYDIANFFIDVETDEQSGITNMKLNKLLYFAQGLFLARFDKPLFGETIEAWQHGPVVPEIYDKYKFCGKNPIEKADGKYDYNIFTGEEYGVLIDTERAYGIYDTWVLRDKTHEADTPWAKNFKTGFGDIIPQKDIKEYFANEIKKLNFKSKLPPSVKKLPSEWYDAEEDAFWEEKTP
ncbi:MAG: DUF4065 domain-containing protein [Clostridiales bacterium]|jgi:uncharacterized phage-associated protein|nr:DUF4065 domain-containing protein [Clostridiales bacterium]